MADPVESAVDRLAVNLYRYNDSLLAAEVVKIAMELCVAKAVKYNENEIIANIPTAIGYIVHAKNQLKTIK